MSSVQYDLNKTRYTHRDYNTIKNDLISAIPSLTREWTNREETDPGIVLIKLMAMFGDSLSFNVDKIALELYISSVTQRKNCSKILQLLGYKMHWYRSARVVARVRLVSNMDEYQNPEHVILKPYVTQFVAGNITYTVVNQGTGSDEVDIYSSTEVVPVLLVEGKPSGEITFTKQDLVNNRYYFKNRNVDEREVVLTCEGNVRCKLTENLYLVSDNSVIYYEFNVDEYDRPYIQLIENWEDIAKSDSRRFTIKYILSSGSQGNVSSNVFNEVINAKSGNVSNLVITNFSSTNPYGEDGQALDNYNSPGLDPQTADEARIDSANYVFTHDTLVTSSDYEKACKRVNNITVSKLVDSQVIINDSLDPEEIVNRALDPDIFRSENNLSLTVDENGLPLITITKEDPVTGETITNTYLSPNQVILYIAYKNFDKENNYYFMNGSARSSGWNLYLGPGNDPYFADPDAIYTYTDTRPYQHAQSEEEQAAEGQQYRLGSDIADAGFYPYRPNENIVQSVRDLISSIHTLNVNVNFGTMKLFPFRVRGTLHLVEMYSPDETLQIVNIVNSALEQAYYPSLHPIGERPNFIEIVDIIQGADVRIKYFDAIGNIVVWAPVISKWIANGGDFEENFDTTSAIMYNGLDEGFNLQKRFLKYKLKNVGVPVSDSDDVITTENGSVEKPDDYGTAYLYYYSQVKGLQDIYKIDINSIVTLQLDNIEELRALCKDMTLKGYILPEGASEAILINNTGLQWMEW